MNKKTLVFGASLKKERYSNFVINRLRQNNHDVVAYGLREGLVNDVLIDTELISYKDIDTVTMYLNPMRQTSYYNHIIYL